MTISFNTKGYDVFIDFIKAYAIMCVLFGHTFLWLDKVGYGVWAGMQVPLFILVQAFHWYKKDKPVINFVKILKRVIFPFFVIEFLTVGIALLFGLNNANELKTLALSGGGYGPGSYYPWIYLQVAILLPLFSPLLCRFSKWVSLIIFIIICQLFEFLFSIIDLPENIYRLLAVRYIFLVPLGWLWAKEGIVINWKTILLSILSLFAILYFEYLSVHDEPWFFTTKWQFHRWPCYFFLAYGFTGILNIVWKRLVNYELIIKYIKVLASSSYEIFLVQMSVIYLINYTSIPFVRDKVFKYIIWLILVWMISIFGGILLNRILNRKSIIMSKND